MSTFKPQPQAQLRQGPRNKKYSLRGRLFGHQTRQGSTLPLEEQWSKVEENRIRRQNEDAKNELSILTSTFSEDNSFNCISNVQTVLEFNRVNSVNVIKAGLNAQLLSATSSVMQSQPQMDVNRPKNSFSHSIGQFSKIRPDSMAQQTPETQQDLFGPAQSEISEYQKLTQSKKLGKSKFSLRKSQATCNTRNEFRVCLAYNDIRYSIRPLKGQQLNQMCVYRHNMQKREKEGQLSKLLCSQFIRFDSSGCECEPKCVWMNRWLNRAEYEDIQSSCTKISHKEWEGCIAQIEKDLPRTQIHCQAFKSEAFLHRLRQVLVEYARLDWEIGYVQGMNIIASVLVYHSINSYEALKVFQLLMRQMGLRDAFKGDLSFSFILAASLTNQLKRLSFDLHSHLVNQGLDLKMFAIGWYLSLLGSFIPLEWMHGVIQKYMRRGWSGINEILISLLLLLKDQLLHSYEQDLMQLLSTSSLQQRSKQLDWQDILIRSDNLLLPTLVL